MEEEVKIREKRERGDLKELFEVRMEAMRREFERQRDEDVREWGKKFEALEGMVLKQR